MRTRKLPNPGTDAAIKQGCTCPIMDNKDLPKNIYMVSKDCPVHCPKTKRVFVVNEE